MDYIYRVGQKTGLFLEVCNSRTCRYTEIAQRMFKYSDIQYTSLTPDKILNNLVYRTLFYVNMYGSYKLSKKQSGFLAHPVVLVLITIDISQRFMVQILPIFLLFLCPFVLFFS